MVKQLSREEDYTLEKLTKRKVIIDVLVLVIVLATASIFVDQRTTQVCPNMNMLVVVLIAGIIVLALGIVQFMVVDKIWNIVDDCEETWWGHE
jgi:hypothetical protein